MPGSVPSPGDTEINKTQNMSPAELPIQKEKQTSKHTTLTEFEQTKQNEIKVAIQC